MSPDTNKVPAEGYAGDEAMSDKADCQVRNDVAEPDIPISDSLKWEIVTSTVEYVSKSKTLLEAVYHLLIIACDVARTIQSGDDEADAKLVDDIGDIFERIYLENEDIE